MACVTCRPHFQGRGERAHNMINDQGVTMYYDDFTMQPKTRASVKTREVQELIRQRDRFLSDNPDLMTTQEEIDRMLSTTFDPVLRLEILFMLISEKLGEMRAVSAEILKLAERVVRE